MKITGTRVVELKVIKLFNDSKNQDNNTNFEAQILVKKILKFFELISIFDSFDHLKIVKKLYFTKYNIKVTGIKKMSALLYMDEKTLYKLRNKYCAVIQKILNREIYYAPCAAVQTARNDGGSGSSEIVKKGYSCTE